MADFDINSILSSLTPEDMDNIKKLASDFLGDNNKKEGTPEKTDGGRTKINEERNLPDSVRSGISGLPDLSQMSAIVPVLQLLNKSDSRLDFIEALKPLLSEPRRKRADEAMNLLRLMSLLPVLKERGML